MAGTKIGGMKAAAKNLARDPDFMPRSARRAVGTDGPVALRQTQLWHGSLVLKVVAFLVGVR